MGRSPLGAGPSCLCRQLALLFASTLRSRALQLPLYIRNQPREGHAECDRNPARDHHGRRLLAALDEPDVRSVDVCRLGQALLRHPDALSAALHHRPERLLVLPPRCHTAARNPAGGVEKVLHTIV